MATIEIFRALMDEYAKHLGFEGVLDESDILSINVEQRFDIDIAYNPERNVVLLASYLPSLTDIEMDRETLYRALLQESFTITSRECLKFCIAPSTEQIAIVAERPLLATDLSLLTALVEQLMEVSVSWLERLRGYGLETQRDDCEPPGEEWMLL